MKAVLVGAETASGTLLPLVDRPFAQHAVALLGEWGVREVVVAAARGAARLAAALGDGARWGCRVRVVPIAGDDPVAAARALALGEESVLVGMLDRIPAQDAFPGPDWGLLGDDLAARLSAAPSPDALWAGTVAGLLASQRRVLEGAFPSILPRGGTVHVARSARVHPRARIDGPAWIGPYCRIGADVTIGENVCLGEGCVVEPGTRLVDAVVAPGTYVGTGLELDGVYVERNRLHHVRLDACVDVPDPFLLSGVRR